MSLPFDHVWWWRSTSPRWAQRLPWPQPTDRKGQRCRVLARGRMNSVLVEFEDDERRVTSRYAVRRAR